VASGNFRTLTSGTPDPPDRALEPGNVPTIEVGGVVPIEPALVYRDQGKSPAGHNGPSPLAELLGGSLRVTAEHPGRYAPRPGGELGRGGIGRVYVAADKHLARDVALKELLPETKEGGTYESLPMLVRFLREARITGKLEHPNIVPVYELGRRDDGTLYYAMRVVRGRTLSRALAGARTLAERLGLLDHFIGLCQAIAYAHSRRVVHRDIKPDNVMIGEFGETVVLDWGMAKAQGADGAEEGGALPSMRALDARGVDVTLDGTLFGTPTHMSPEQARGAHGEVDERSDVWALGVVLYTILTGRTPFDGKNLLDLIQKIREGVHVPPRAVDAEVPGELSAVAERALRADPALRYPTAKELLRDVQAYRSGARVGAYEYSSFDLLRRFIERHRAAVVASAVGLSVALVLAAASYVRLAAARDLALQAEHRATSNEQEARKSERAAKESLSLVLVEKAEQAMNEGDRTTAEVLASEALRLGERADARGLVVSAESGFRPEPRLTLPSTAGCARYALALAPGLLACARNDGISLYGLRDGVLRGEPLAGPTPASLELASDGSLLAVVHGDGRIVLRRVGERAAVLERSAGPGSIVAISGDGKYLARGGSDGTVTVWSVAEPDSEQRFSLGQGLSALAFAPDGATLVAGGDLGLLALRDLRGSRTRTLLGHTGTVRSLAFAQQGRYLASGGADRTIRFWDIRDGAPISTPLVHGDAITALSWAPDGRLLAFGSKDKSFHLVDVKSPERRAEVRFHEDPVDWVGIAADGSELSTLSRDTGVVHWSLASMKTPSTLLERGNVLAFAFVPGTDGLVSAGVGSEGVGIFDVKSGLCETRLPAGIDRVRALAVSEDGRQLAFAGSAAKVLLWDLPARVPLRVFDGPKDEVRAVAFSGDGRWLASAGLDRTLHVVDNTTFATVADLVADAPLQALAFAPGTQALVSGGRDGMLSVWDVASKRRVMHLKAHDDWVLAVAVSPVGKLIATASADRHVRVWDGATGRLAVDLTGHEGKVLSVAFSADGRLLASGSEDRTVRIWDPETGREVSLITRHTGAVRAVHFAANRPVLASAGDDGTVRFWKLEALTEPAAALGRRVQEKYRVELVGTRVVQKR
jgi:WD40 repeat protein